MDKNLELLDVISNFAVVNENGNESENDFGNAKIRKRGNPDN